MKRVLAIILCAVMLVGLLPVGVFAADTAPNAVVFAASDYQYKSGSSPSTLTQQLGGILSQVKKDYETMNGFLFAGDYSSNYAYDDSVNGMTEMLDTVHGYYTDMLEVLIQGNHDDDTLVTNGVLAAGGNHDAAAYGVYVINEQDYMWYNNDETTIRNTAAALEAYLKTKADADYDKPIFVVSHLPLHYCYRTYKDGDGMYANYIFDVLNAAGESGLNIIFLYGHNHSHGWDSYLGYGSVYLPVGDTIKIAQASNSVFEEETLYFTYMNAGFVGYIDGGASGGGSNNGSDYTLTSTVFEIYDNEVVIKRYSADGLHNLKSAGALNMEYSDSNVGITEPNTTEYTSPQTLGIRASSGDVTVEAPGITSVSASVTELSDLPSTYSAGVSCDITVGENYTSPIKAIVTIPLPEGFERDKFVHVWDGAYGGTRIASVKADENGMISFAVTHFSRYDLTQASSEDATPDNPLDEVTTSEGVAVVTPGITELQVTINPDHSNLPVGCTAHVAYDIVPTGYTEGNAANITIKVPAEIDVTKPVTVWQGPCATGEKVTITDVSETGHVTFTINTFTTTHFELTQGVNDEGASDDTFEAGDKFEAELPTTITKITTSAVTDIEDGTYIIVPKSDTSKAMTQNQPNSGGFSNQSIQLSGNSVVYEAGMEDTIFWKLTRNGETVTLQAPNGQYLNIGSGNGSASLGSSQDITITIDSDAVTFKSGNQYLDYYKNNGQVFSTYSNSSPNDNNRYLLYKVTGGGSVVTGEYHPISSGSSGGTIYRLVTSGQITSGKNYLIVNTGSNGTGYALTSSGGRVNVTIANGEIVSVDAGAVFLLDGSNGSYTIQNGSTYVYPQASYSNWHWSYSGITGSSEEAVTFTSNGTAFQISKGFESSNYFGTTTTTAYLRYSSSSFSSTGNSSDLYLYEEVNLPASADEYAKAELSKDANLTYVADVNTIDLVESDIHHWLRVTVAEDEDGTNSRILGSTEYDLDLSQVDMSTPGTYYVFVSYKDVIIGAIPVTVEQKSVYGYAIAPMHGTVAVGNTKTNSKIRIYFDDALKSFEDVPLLTSYITGGSYNLHAAGTYGPLEITYNGKVISTEYYLTVTERLGNNFPDYPAPGSVSVDKIATGVDFQTTGLTRVELSTSGLPSNKGVDVVIVLDTSSSMGTTVEGTDKSRLDVLKDSLKQMLTQFNQENPTTGLKPDIDIAIIDFNGYANRISDTSLTNTYRGDSDQSTVFTGEHKGTLISELTTGLSAADFENNADMTAERITAIVNAVDSHSGTNYDAAMANAYTLLASKKLANTEEREQYMLFLSDGAPFRYNGYNQAAADSYASWAQWLTGYWADEDALKNDSSIRYGKDHAYFYNGDGNVHPHRVAEAIKGTPGRFYEVVDPRAEDTGYIDQWEGLGAKIYSIGFGLADDKDVTMAIQQELIQVISSGEGFCFPNVQTAEELSDAFSKIAGSISYAAQNAYYEDKMGSHFDLQINPSFTLPDGTVVNDFDNSITVKVYDVYTKDQIGQVINGHAVTADDVGKTYGQGTTLETVTFYINERTGYLEASSTALPGENILSSGIVHAKYFMYNTTNTTNKVMLADGSTYDLPGEAFRWDIGTINEQKFVLSYLVRMVDAFTDVGLPAGSYATNEYAKLTYVNWLGNTVTQNTVSPTMAWKGAQVSYGFYLVNENGKPLQADGSLASNFLTAYKVTSPVLYSMVNLNTSEDVKDMEVLASSVNNRGYKLYDADAGYHVTVYSGSGNSNWVITNGDGKVASTYVTNYATANDYTNENKSGSPAGENYDYTNTVVWFAVVWEIGPKDDTVVIDHGLSVEIHVLPNDLFGAETDYALKYVGSASGIPENRFGELPLFETTTFAGVYGTAKLEMDHIRYTPRNMSMDGKDQFAYIVQYTGAEHAGYYYGVVTVIPATSIYYEDSFVTFESFDWGGSKLAGDSELWSQVGTVTDTTQSEDRPGTFSLSITDANNIYGFDAAYKSMTQYSMGSARKVTVTEKQNYATATFTFTGTGFDVFSMTSNKTGSITVRVKSSDDNGAAYNKLFFVDTYYGYVSELCEIRYTYQADTNQWLSENLGPATDATVETQKPAEPADGDQYTTKEWIWTAEPGVNNALYQIPVMKVCDLTYGTYDVKITASYNEAFNHGQDGQDKTATNNSYDFYLDAIRIYDPADDGANDQVIEDVYVADKEGWPTYIELRDKLIEQDSFAAGNATGAVFIDGKDQNVTMEEYTSYGPNNEVYLQKGQAVVFRLDLSQYVDAEGNSIVADVQVGLKSANGKNVNASIQNISVSGQVGNEKLIQVTSNTEMYYSIFDQRVANIMISVPQVTEDMGILSITSIKVTCTEKPAETATFGLEVSEEAVGFALMAMSLEYEEFYAPEAPVVTPVFVPETLQVKVNNTSVKVGSSVRVTVTTGSDVESLIVNGQEVTDYFENRRTGQRTWSLKLDTDEVGSLDIYVQAVNADGITSEPVVSTVAVTETYTNVSNLVSDIINSLLSRWF